MIIYLTLNDAPGGIFSGQVIDVVKFLTNEFASEIRLVAFVSLRNYRSHRRSILSELPDSIVVPMFPGVRNWRMNRLLFLLICGWLRPRLIIARSVLATCVAMV